MSILIINQNGYHVVLKSFDVFSNEQTLPLIDYLKSNLLDVAATQHGCCAIQKILEEENLTSRTQLISKIIKLSSRLIWHSQGHYLLSFMVLLKIKRNNLEIAKKLLKESNFLAICQSKHTSSIIEKLIEYGCCKLKKAILNYFLQDKEALLKLANCQSQYGVSSKILLNILFSTA